MKAVGEFENTWRK